MFEKPPEEKGAATSGLMPCVPPTEVRLVVDVRSEEGTWT